MLQKYPKKMSGILAVWFHEFQLILINENFRPSQKLFVLFWLGSAQTKKCTNFFKMKILSTGGLFMRFKIKKDMQGKFQTEQGNYKKLNDLQNFYVNRQ